MMRRILLSGLCLLMAGMLSAQGLLFKITGNGSKSPSYLLATNNYTDRTYIDSIPGLYRCFGSCRCIITEFAIQDYEALAALRKAAILPDGQKLSDFFTREQYLMINDAMRTSIGMEMTTLGLLCPSYITSLYRDYLLHTWINYDEETSISTFFQQVAAERNMKIFGLDNTAETIFMQFGREPMEWQCKELLRIIEHPDEEIRQEKALFQLYKHGKLTDMAWLVLAPDNQSTVSYSDYQVFAKRNKEWCNRLGDHLKGGGCFIVLDAIYLGGDQGLISSLRSAGYRVKAVKR